LNLQGAQRDYDRSNEPISPSFYLRNLNINSSASTTDSTRPTMMVFEFPVKGKRGRPGQMAIDLEDHPSLLDPNHFKGIMRKLADVMNNPTSKLWGGKLIIDMTEEEINFLKGFFLQKSSIYSYGSGKSRRPEK